MPCRYEVEPCRPTGEEGWSRRETFSITPAIAASVAGTVVFRGQEISRRQPAAGPAPRRHWDLPRAVAVGDYRGAEPGIGAADGKSASEMADPGPRAGPVPGAEPRKTRRGPVMSAGLLSNVCVHHFLHPGHDPPSRVDRHPGR